MAPGCNKFAAGLAQAEMRVVSLLPVAAAGRKGAEKTTRKSFAQDLTIRLRSLYLCRPLRMEEGEIERKTGPEKLLLFSCFLVERDSIFAARFERKHEHKANKTGLATGHRVLPARRDTRSLKG